MGRLAGPSLNPETIRATKDAQKRFDDWMKAYKDTIPLVHPPASRRLGALLWLIAEREGLAIGAEGFPPLTRDMRRLLADRLIRIERKIPPEFWGPMTDRTPRRNYLVITPAGRTALGRAKVSEQDKRYIGAALYTGVGK